MNIDFRNIDWEMVSVGFLFGLVVFLVIGVVILLFFSLGFHVREQAMMFDCIENGGIWLNNYQIGCTYPHG